MENLNLVIVARLRSSLTTGLDFSVRKLQASPNLIPNGLPKRLAYAYLAVVLAADALTTVLQLAFRLPAIYHTHSYAMFCFVH